MSPPIKVILSFLAGAAHRIALSPPQGPPTKDDRVYKATHFEKMPRFLSTVNRVITSGILMTEAVMLLSLYFQNTSVSNLLSNICANPAPSFDVLSGLSPQFLLGVGMMYTAALLRLWCYQALGTLFTWEITIRRDHKLITSGPYAFVRHPSYTGIALLNIGTCVTCLCSGSYIDECNIFSTPVRWVVFGWMALQAWVIVMLLGRGKIEDAGLKKEFGESWDRYSHSVQCSFVPGII